MSAALVASVLALSAPHEGAAGLAAVEVRGEVSEGWARRLREAADDGISRAGLTVSPVARPACDEPGCWVAVAQEHGLSRVIDVVVEVEGHAYAVRIRILRGDDGEPLATVAETCNPCAVEEAAEMVAASFARTRFELDRLRSAPASLRVTTTPDGAILRLEGRIVGRSPYEGLVSAGTLVLEAELAGFQPASRSVALAPDARERVHLVLEPVARPRPRPRMAVGAGLLGAGGALAIAGGVLVGIDSRPWRGRCSGRDVDVDGDCRFLYDTLSPGAVLVAAGAALATTGVVLVVRASKRRGREARR